MKNPVYAPSVKTPYFFDDSVRWIHAVGVANYSMQMFRKTFVLNAIPENAVLLAMAANYAEIFINGRAAASLAVRSYVFDKNIKHYATVNCRATPFENLRADAAILKLGAGSVPGP